LNVDGMLTVITNNLGGDLRGEVLLSYTAKHLNHCHELELL